MTKSDSLTNIEVADVLEQAADIITVRGHTKWKLEDSKTGTVCAIGAINVALTGSADAIWVGKQEVAPLFRFVNDAVRGYLGIPSIPAWNNAPERTQGEVEEAFRMTAKELRNS